MAKRLPNKTLHPIFWGFIIVLFVLTALGWYSWNLQKQVTEQRRILQVLGLENLGFQIRHTSKKGMEQYEWYLSFPWPRITSTVLAGIDSSLKPKEVVEHQYGTAPALRTEGGLGSENHNLSLGNGQLINTKEDLLKLLGPIDTPSKALTLVYLTTPDLAVKENVLVGHVYSLENDAGYLVQVVDQNSFGCGPHDDLQVIFHVQRNGQVDWAIGESPNPQNGGICVD